MPSRVPVVFALLLTLTMSAAAQRPYFPDRFDWQRRAPEDVGLDAAALAEAVKFAIANENPGPKDPVIAHAQTFGATEPFDALVGPVKDQPHRYGFAVIRSLRP